MSGKLNVYKLGQSGVNLVKDPLHMADDEVTQAQNAEIVQDQNTGGEGALSKRGGLAALNGSAMSGSVTGIFGWPLKTTYTRTLYAAKGTEDTTTFMTTTNGTSWTDTTSPLANASFTQYTDENNARDARRMAAFRNYLIYSGNAYTKSTDNPPIVSWDGTNALTVTSVLAGPSSNGSVPFAIVDWLVANSVIYLAVHDQGGSGANLSGRVLSLDLTTGVLRQIASGFGAGTGEMTGGAPSCLAFYQNQLWVGLNGSATTDGIGKIVRCYPTLDTTWTSDVSNLVSHISTLCVFKGDLYAGTQSSVSTGAKIYKRAATTGAWTAQVTSGGGAGGSGHYASLIEYSSALYAVEFHTTTPIVHIVTSTDGTTWTTSRDVDANDGGTASLLPGSSATYGSDLYFVFRASSASAADGFIMRRSGGTWTKVVTDNFGGPIATLVQRSA